MAGVNKGDEMKQSGQGIDTEWLLLMIQAKEMGLSIEDVQSFLADRRTEQTQTSQVLLTGTAD